MFSESVDRDGGRGMQTVCLRRGAEYAKGSCCCCLPCNHCSNWTWVVEEILAFGTRLRSTQCKEFKYLKLCRPAYFVRTTQFQV